ncbi:MAG: hypothetical protein BWK78_01870 [Thiotrichaceae bacterium IS1]|nr:MAG: hypothetical protein BWK78_01870 [Thiotrichaceae bacterium IS1]
MITPVGASLFTRKEEQSFDYDWKYAEIGILKLLEIAKKVYVTVLGRDRVGDITTAKFAIIQQGQQVGLLIADMPTLRRDFANKLISTTLYLEFGASDKVAVSNATTTLLNPSSQDRQVFLDYAEDLLKSPQKSLKPIQLPKTTGTVTAVKQKKGLVFSPVDGRNQYAGYLTHLPDNFCFVSTGYAGLSHYQELESLFNGKLLVLTLSEEVKTTGPTTSGQIQFSWTMKKWVPGLIVVLVLSIGGYMIFQKMRTESEQQQVQQLQSALTTEKEKSSELEKAIQLKEKEKYDLQSQLEQQTKQVQELKVETDKKDAEMLILKQQKAESDKKIEELETKLVQLNQGVTANYTLKANSSLPKPEPSVPAAPKEDSASTGKQEDTADADKKDVGAKEENADVISAQNDLTNFLKLKAVGNDVKKTMAESIGTMLEKYAKEPKTYPFFANKYCVDFIARYQTLEEAIEKNKDDTLPENYCKNWKDPQKKSTEGGEIEGVKACEPQCYFLACPQDNFGACMGPPRWTLEECPYKLQ